MATGHVWKVKALIISSETFKEKKKVKYNTQTQAKQINKVKGMGKHSKGIRFWGVSGKKERGKEKGPIGKVTRLR